MITLTDYWMGHDMTHPTSLTPQIEKDAACTVELANRMLIRARGAGVETPINPGGAGKGTNLTSGWRPPAINAATPGAAARSRHMTGQAVDIYDPEGEIDEWLLKHQVVLIDLGLWMEHPGATKGWCHVQTMPPRSGNRVFYP